MQHSTCGNKNGRNAAACVNDDKQTVKTSIEPAQLHTARCHIACFINQIAKQERVGEVCTTIAAATTSSFSGANVTATQAKNKLKI
jgi:hypothetical protein